MNPLRQLTAGKGIFLPENARVKNVLNRKTV